MDPERRRHTRYRFSCNVTGGPSTRGTQESDITVVLHGQLVDLSTGGAGVVTDRPLTKFTVIPWRLYLPDVPVPLPVLAQVRWVEPAASRASAFRLGLAFLA
jgi:hypothetical protein